jgi:hypothetical protein
MRRRALLAMAAGSLAGLAGCSTRRETSPPASSPQESPTATTGSPDPTTTSPSATGTDTPTEEATATEDEPRPLDVDLEQVPYVAGANEVPEGLGVDPDDIVPESDVPAALLEPLRAARSGGYVTDDVSEDLLAAVDEFRKYNSGRLIPYVRLDGTAYEFSAEVPTFVARLADETVEEYDPDRVAQGDAQFDSEAVEAFVRTLVAGGTHNPRTDYRRNVVPDAVQSFLEEVDYLEDYEGVSPIRTERVDAGPPHVIEVQALTEEDMWGRRVVDAAELDPTVRSFVRTVVESDHRAPATVPTRSEYFTDDVPDAFLDVFGGPDAPYVRLDGTVYGVGAGSPSYDVPIDVVVEEETGDDMTFELTLDPSSEGMESSVEEQRGMTLTSNGGLPSVLWVTHDGTRRLLDSDAYEREHWRDVTEDGPPGKQPVNEVLESIEFHETVAATYAVPGDLPDGTYTSRGLFTVSWSVPDRTPGEHVAYPFRLRVTVERG